jgi:hypothetical protein
MTVHKNCLLALVIAKLTTENWRKWDLGAIWEDFLSNIFQHNFATKRFYLLKYKWKPKSIRCLKKCTAYNSPPPLIEMPIEIESGKLWKS